MKRSGAWLLMALALALYCRGPVFTAWNTINSNDFKHMYLGMKALLDGISPYSFQALHHQAALQGYRQISLNPYVYLPFTGHALAFLAPFRLEQAVVIWFVMNHLFVAGSVVLLSGLWPRQRLWAVAGLTLAFAVSFPLIRTLTAGQLNLALLLMILAARELFLRRRDRLAGAVLAFATLFKLMPGIFGIFLLLQRRWRAVGAAVVSGVLLLAASTLAAGWKTTLEFLPILGQMGYGKSTWPEVFSFWNDATNQSLNSFFSHIFTAAEEAVPWINLGQGAANAATWVVVGLLLVAYIGVQGAAQRGRGASDCREFSPADDLGFCATLLLGLLIPSLMWDHYLVMAIYPAAVLLRTSVMRRRWGSALAVLACYIVICLPWDFYRPEFRAGAGIILMSVKLWPALVLFGLALCFQHGERSRARLASLPSNACSSREPIYQEKPLSE